MGGETVSICVKSAKRRSVRETGMWSFSNPVQIVFGAGASAKAADHIRARRWALVTYDMPLFKENAAQIASVAGEPVVTIDNIVANPDFADLATSCEMLSRAKGTPEVIVALGGGSIIDAAKVLAASGGSFDAVRGHLTGGKPLKDASFVPIIAVPSTAGTGSEVTSWATVWDAANGRKYSLAHRNLYPEVAIVDPQLALGAPRTLTLATGLDALSHALESIWNVSANPISANFAIEAAKEVIETLPLLLDDLSNLELRSRQARAATMAGLAFSNTKTALAHNISYDITLKRGTPHGIACSFCLPAVMQWSIGADAQCDANLRRIFGADLRAGANHLMMMIESLGVSTDPSDYGLNEIEWRGLVERAMQGERGKNFIGRLNLAA
jgi:phosphonate metabolism-associated iron-containing alcohol dehydrogenase